MSSTINNETPMDTYSTTSVSLFTKLGKIGEGTYGTVYRALDTRTSTVVALKRIRVNTEQAKSGFPLTSLREIALLRSLRHKNLVSLTGVAVGRQPSSVFLLFELCHADLATLLDNAKDAHDRRAAQTQSSRRASVSTSSSSSSSASSAASASMLASSSSPEMSMPPTIPIASSGWSLPQIKRLMFSVLEGVAYLHSRYIFHRDLKLSNVLLTAQGGVKLADFGLARVFSNPLQAYTPRVVTLWYRAPELLLQTFSVERAQHAAKQAAAASSSASSSSLSTSTSASAPNPLPAPPAELRYHSAIDIWSCGCILAELLLGRPLLPGNNEHEQIALICRLLGTPTTKIWPAFRQFALETASANEEDSSAASSSSSVSANASSSAPIINNYRLPYSPYSALQHTLTSAQPSQLISAQGCNLVSRMLTYDPSKRVTAAKALAHPWFFESPAMCPEEESLLHNHLLNVPSTTSSTSTPTSSTLSQFDQKPLASVADLTTHDAMTKATTKKRRRVEVSVADLQKKSVRL